MRSSSLLALLAPIALAAPASAQTAPVSSAADAPILAAANAFNDARMRYDAKALDALLTPDYIEVSPRGEIDRRAQVLGFYTPDKAGPVPPMTPGPQEVRRYGDMAIVIGTIDIMLPAPPPGPGAAPGPATNAAPIKRSVRITYVERRVGGRWLIASTQYTGVAPPR